MVQHSYLSLWICREMALLQNPLKNVGWKIDTLDKIENFTEP